jgi:uncharacterized protein
MEMDLHTLAAGAVALLFLAGVVGSVVPWMPGPLLILAGALLWAIVTDFATVGLGRLAILAALALAAFLTKLAAGAVGARHHGGSRWGVAGAIIGALIGLFFGPLGLLVGPIVGAVLGEIARGATLESGIRSGVGALIGLLAGLVVDLAISLSMIAVFLWWVWA